MNIAESIQLIAKALAVDENKLNAITNDIYINDKINVNNCYQLQELGFPIYQEIAKLKNTSISEARVLIEEGKVSAVDYNNILLTNYFIQ